MLAFTLPRPPLIGDKHPAIAESAIKKFLESAPFDPDK